MLESLSAQHFKDGRYIFVKAEKLVIFNEGLSIDTSLSWNLVRRLWSIYYEVSLVAYFILRGFIGQLFNELISLNVNVLSSGNRLRCPHFTLEELFRGARLCGSLYFLV